MVLHIDEFKYDDGYQKAQVDLSQYADGGIHTLAFSYKNGDTGDNSLLVDDISLDSAAGSVFDADPASLGEIPDPDSCDDYIGGPPLDVTFAVAGKVASRRRRRAHVLRALGTRTPVISPSR